MFERYTERARQVVDLAGDEARTLGHDYIGTEHLLLGVLREREGVGGRVLASLGIGVDDARVRIVDIVERGSASASAPPFTPRGKRVLALAAREAASSQHRYIGTEHILLALVHEGEGVAALVLRQMGGDAETVRSAVAAMLPRSGPAPA
jgi:ATP-dependent Clp protease ATP-binding subunit ClpC